VCAGAADGGLKVTGVRFWSLGDVTRVAIETTGPFDYTHARLDNPDRLFFDIAGARTQFPTKGMYTVKVEDRLVRQIRVAQPQPGRTRIVLDLESAVEYSSSQLSNPDRLIIEVRTQAPKPDANPSASGSKRLSKPSQVKVDADLLAAAPASKPEPRAEPAVRPASSNAEPARAAVTAETAVAVPSTESAQAEPRQPVPPADPKAAAVTVPDPDPGAPRFFPQLATVAMTPTAKLTLPAPNAEVRTPVSPKTAASAPSGPVPQPARASSAGSRSLTRVLGLKLGRVVIDAGHGGQDHGTTGPSGFTEKELVLDVAQRLGALLIERMGSEVFYTREDDTFIPLEERTRFANQKRADLFISIHANSSPSRKASGVETYYLNFTTAPDSLEVAARENAGAGSSVFELRELLQKIALKDKAEESREFATRIQNSLHSLAVKSGLATRNRGVKRAPFVVLIGASMPSILTEIGFLSNPEEEKLLRKPEHRQKIAEALYKGIANYASTLSRFEVARRAGDE
jgi:N-acetylmuramoyl-L-alanine amidase